MDKGTDKPNALTLCNFVGKCQKELTGFKQLLSSNVFPFFMNNEQRLLGFI